jgi:sigma-B regulation protein RsbU (phosphoserine phosphatase)
MTVPAVNVRPALPGQLLAELLPIVGEISAVLDPGELLPAIAQQLRRIVDYRILDIFLPEKDGTLVPAFVEGYDCSEQAFRLRIHPGLGVVGAAAAGRAPIFVPDVAADPRYIPFVDGIRAELAIPLVHRDRLVGVLNIEGPDPEAFTVEAQTALGVLAGHLAVAIENATLYRETRWYAGLLGTLYEIGKETGSILDLDELLTRVAEVVKRVIDYEMFGIVHVDERRGELVLRKAVSYGGTNEKTRVKIGEGLTGTAASAWRWRCGGTTPTTSKCSSSPTTFPSAMAARIWPASAPRSPASSTSTLT